ncbi:contact-dependent growth inhibition system immunity protein [Pseudomonas sp. LARHCG127]
MNFRELERKESVGWLSEENPSALTEWYLSVRDTPLAKLGVGDICRSLRQSLFVCEILPVAVELLNNDVLAGERYDGELISAIASLDVSFFKENSYLVHQIVGVLYKAIQITSDAELLKESLGLIESLKNVNE